MTDHSLTLYSAINNLKDIAWSIPNIRTVKVGDVYKLNEDPEVEYSVINISQGTHRSDSDWMYYNFNIFFIDRLTSDMSNKLDIQSHAIAVLNYIISHLPDDMIIEEQYEFQVFEERFHDLCAGAYTTVTIQVPLSCVSELVPDYAYSIYTTDGRKINYTGTTVNVHSGRTDILGVEIYDHATDIAPTAFSRCTNLKRVTIPKSIKFISDFAFYDCVKLEEFYSYNPVAPTLGEDSLTNAGRDSEITWNTIYVPIEGGEGWGTWTAALPKNKWAITEY